MNKRYRYRGITTGGGFVTRRPPYGQELDDEPSPLDKWDGEHFEVIGNELDNLEKN